MRRVRRLSAVLMLMGIVLMLAAPDADADTGQVTFPELSVSSLVAKLTAGPQHWDNVPRQQSGTAAGGGSQVPASATRANQGAGHAPGTGKGALPAYAPYQRPVKQGPSQSGTRTGFSAKTSHRDAAKSTATSDYFVNADGSVTRKFTQAPINFKDGASGWQPINTSVGMRSDGRWAEKANSLSVNFASSSSAGNLVSFAVDGSHGISYGLRGAAPVAGQASGSTVTYSGVLPSTDLAVEPTPTGVKESIVLHSARAANSWVFPLDVTGLTPKAGKSGEIDLVDSSGKTVEDIPPAYAYDSKVDPRSGDPATTHNVSYSLETAGGKTALVVTLDPAWLHSPDRVMPVTVDPTMTDGWETTYAESNAAGDHSSEQSIKVGSYDDGIVADSAAHKANAFISRWYDSFDGSGVTVTAASLSVFDSWASTCNPMSFLVAPVTAAWTPSGVTSYPGPSYGASIGSVTPNVPEACANTAADRSVGDWVTVPLSTSAIQGWANGTTKDYGLALYAAVTDPNHWKQFGSFNDPGYQPFLSVTYTGEVAPQVYQQYPPSGAVATSTTPEFSAFGFSPAGSTLKYDFQVYDSGGTKVVDSGLVAGGNWTVPASKLAWGQTYYWTVQANDGTAYSAAPPWSEMSVQVKQPLITSSLSQNSSEHGFDPSVGNYTTSATDADISSAGPALQVTRDYNSRDPRWAGAFGASWSSIFDAKAAEQYSPSGAVTGVVVTYPDGSEVGYGKNPDGSFTPPQGRFATFKAVTGGYTLTDKNDTVYTFTQALGSGAYGITSVTDANGRALNLAWAGGHVSTMTSAVSGRALHLTWATPTGAAAAHVTAVISDPVQSTDPASTLTWKYTYAGDQLTEVCDPGDTDPNCTRYAYNTGSQYQSAAMDLGPQSYWPLSEASGTMAKSSVLLNEGTDNAAYSNVTLGQAGPLAGGTATAAGFNGTSSTVTLPKSLANDTDSQSISLWFKTSAGPGVLFSYNSQPMDRSTLSGYYTPSIYVGTSGKLYAEFWYGSGIAPITTSSSVADGKWHHVVLSAAGNSQTLYLDGSAVGNVSGQVSLGSNVNAYDQNYTFIGGGYLGGGWPDEPHGSGVTGSNDGYATYFNGSIADVGFYTRPLVAADVTALYSAGTHPAALLHRITRPSGGAYATVNYNAASDVTAVADENATSADPNAGIWKLSAPVMTGSSQVYRASVLGTAPQDYWRLGDTAGASVAADEVRGSPATYNGVTLGTGGPFSDETAAQFNGTSSYLSLPAKDRDGWGTGSGATAGFGAIGLWFKTTSANQVLYGMQSAAVTAGAAKPGFTPALYIGNDGHLESEFWIGDPSKTMSSPSAVNDGKWHFAALLSSSSGQGLYVDGTRVAVINGQNVQANDYSYVTVGAGYLGGSWPDTNIASTTTKATYFTGQIAEVSWYNYLLTAAQVQAQWNASMNSTGLTPVETAQVTDPGQHTLTYQYDPLNGNRQLSDTDALGNKTSYGYDTGGFEHTVTDPDGDMTVTGHDPRGNVVSTTTCQDQSASKCSTEYFTYYPDDTSAQLTTADPRNDLPLTMRDGRSASSTDNTYLTSYGYDAHGNETTETSPAVTGFPNGRTVTTTYSDGTSAYPAADSGNVPAGLPVKTVTPGGAVNSVAYFQDGDVASTTDADGLVTRYTYDGVGQVTSKTVISDSYPQGLVTTYQYDNNGQVTTESDPMFTDRVTGAQHTPVTTTQYDADGNETSQTVSDKTGGDAPRTTSWTYDTDGRQIAEKDANANAGAGSGGSTTFTYDGYGNKASETTPDGTETDYAYNADGDLTDQTLRGYTGDPVSPSAAANLAESHREYDPAGRLALIKDALGNITSYTYTDDGLVATVTKTDAKNANNVYVLQANQYDAAGNLTQQTTNNGATVTQYQVDAAARTTTTTVDPSGADRVTQVSYTPDDLESSVTQSGPSGSQTTTYTYDPAGNQTSESLTQPGAGGPAARFPLTQASGTAVPDSVPGGQTATAASSGVTWTGSAVSLDGASGHDITTPGPVLDTTGSFTVSAWADLAGNTSADQVVLSQSAGTDAGFYLKYSASRGTWQFVRPQADTTDPVNSNTTAVGTTATTGTWAFLTGVYDASTGTMAFYVNGAAIDSATDPTPIDSYGPVLIGAGKWDGTVGSYFDGQIANVQAYPRALSASEVSSLYSLGRNGGTVTSGKLTTSWKLDNRGLATSMTDPAGNITRYAYDEAGNLAVTTEPAVPVETGGGAPSISHPVSTTGFNTFGEAVENTDPNGNTTLTSYDADGNKVSETNPYPPGADTSSLPATTWTYDSDGQTTSEKQPDGETTRYLYDQLGDTAQVTQPDGSTIHTTYDTNGEALSVTDGTGAQSTATYDWMGRKLTSTTLERYPTAQTLTTNYSYAASSGNPGGAFLASETSPGQRTTTYGYDNLGEQTAVTDGYGNTTQTGYDFKGNPVKTTLPDGSFSETDYNTSDQPTAQRQYAPNGATPLTQTSDQYDDAGNLAAATDGNGHTTTFAHDASGMVTQEVQPVSDTHSITASFGYDASGNQTRYTDGRGSNWYTTYNAMDLPATQIEPATGTYSSAADSTTTYGYTDDGQLKTVTEPGGVSVSMDYDALGDLKDQSGSGADAATATRTFTYDSDGRVKTAATTTAGTAGNAGYQAATNESFGYDDRGDLLTASGSAGSSSFTYEGDGLMTSRTDAAGTTSYTYDNDGRLATLNDPATGTQLTYGYNKLSQPHTIQYGSTGQTRTLEYNALHELSTDTLVQGTSTLASIAYTYDNNGNLKTKDTTGVVGASNNTYSYDYANRLISWDNGSATTNYGYDDAGNRIQVGANVYTYDARDELTSDGINSYTYTARGTLSSQSSTSGGTVGFSSDAYGQQVTAGTQSYGLDAAGRDITDTTQGGGGTRTFAYSGADNTVASDGEFTYTYDPSGSLTGINTAGATGTSTGRLALTDQHDDVVGTFTAKATSLAGSTTYDPLGNVTVASSPFGQLGYQSGWTDDATGKVNMGSRWYNPAAGQFMNKDTASVSPVPDEAAANPFAYVGDNPMIGTDPSGHCSWWDAACFARSAVHKVKAVAHRVIRKVARVYHKAVRVVKRVIHAVRRAVRTVTRHVADAWHYTVHYARSSWHYVQRTYHQVRKQWHAAVHKVATAYHAVKKRVVAEVKKVARKVVHAASQAVVASAKYLKNHAAAVASFVVSTAVFAGCEAASVGVGTIGCSALAGAAGGLVEQGFKCADDGGSACSLSSFGDAALEGGVSGAVGGVLGALGGKLLSAVAPKALAAVGGLFGKAASDAGTEAVDAAGAAAERDAASDAASSTVDSSAGKEPEPSAGREENSGESCETHSFTGSTRVLMADGSSKPIDQVKAGDKIADAVPGQKGTQVHAVSKVIVTRTDRDFVDVTIAPVGKGATAKLASAGRKLRSKAAVGLAAAFAAAAVIGGSHAAAATGHGPAVTARAQAAPAAAASAGVQVHGATLTTTFHHPFYDETRAAFTDAKDLRPGDVLQTPGGQAQVTAVRLFHADTVTYDLTIGGLHTYYVEAGDTPVLVHNYNVTHLSCGGDVGDEEGQVGYGRTTLSKMAFKVRQKLGYYGADHNVAVARVEGPGGVRFLGTSSTEAGHAEGHILDELTDGETITHLYSERSPCPDMCDPELSGDSRSAGAKITWSVPYFSPSTAGGRAMNSGSRRLLSGMIAAMRGRDGL